MPHPDSAALTADLRLFKDQVVGRALNSSAVALLATATAVFACACQISAVQRTGAGIVVALVALGIGEALSRVNNKRIWWFGTSIVAAAYALGYFFAQASHYIGGVAGLGSSYPCWLLTLGFGALAAMHANRNVGLRWAVLPFTIGTSGLALYQALTSGDTISLLGFTCHTSAAASVVGLAWWAGLCLLYKQLEINHDQSERGWTVRMLYRTGHEVLFVLAAVNALALPKFCSTMQLAPLWWALEMPIMLAICWRSRTFVKHSLIMGVWGLSAFLLMSSDLDLAPVTRMAVPVSGLIMALAYSNLKSDWKMWQKRIGYSVYLYGSVVVAAAVPLLHVGTMEALPYWFVEAATVLVLALALKDRILQYAGTAFALVALAVYAAHWQNWYVLQWAGVVTACYAFSLTYRFVQYRGDWPLSPYVPLPGSHTLTATGAFLMELLTAGLGWVVLMSGCYLLFDAPYNTAGWGASSLTLIIYGFATRRVGHRASGLLAMALAAAKLSIFDLSGKENQTTLSLFAVGACAIAASIFYLVEFNGSPAKKEDNPPDSGGKNPSDDNTDSGSQG